MARDEFDVAGNFVAVKDLLGELVFFTPTEYVEEVQTDFGTKDAVVTDLVVLSQDGQPEYVDVLIFQGSLIGALKRRIHVSEDMDRDPVTGLVTEYEITTSRRVLGVIAKGDAKKGQNAPFILAAASDEQVELARKYQDANPTPGPVRKVVKKYLPSGIAGNIDVVVDATAAPTRAVRNAPAVVEQNVPAEDDPWAVDA